MRGWLISMRISDMHDIPRSSIRSAVWVHAWITGTIVLLSFTATSMGQGGERRRKVDSDTKARAGAENQRTEDLRCPTRPPVRLPHPLHGRPAHPFFSGGFAIRASP